MSANSGFGFGVRFAIGILLVASIAWACIHDPKGVVEGGGWAILISAILFGTAMFIFLMSRLSIRGHDLALQALCFGMAIVLFGGVFSHLFPNSPYPRELTLVQKVGGWTFMALAVVSLALEFRLPEKKLEAK